MTWTWRKIKKGASCAKTASSGYQEALIRVNGGYAPNTIIVQSGKPVRLVFVREEKSTCSEMIVIPDLQKSVILPFAKEVIVDLFPPRAGTYPFHCQIGLYKGTIIVK